MKLIYSASDIQDAQRVAGLLRARGIRCKVLGKTLYESVQALAVKGLNPLTVWVERNEDYAKAVRTLHENDRMNGVRVTRDYPSLKLTKRTVWWLMFGLGVLIAISSFSFRT